MVSCGCPNDVRMDACIGDESPMILNDLRLSQLRHFDDLRLQFKPSMNFISGINGSGKTSILEAIYLLGTGHSFRTRDIASLILQGCDRLNVFARFADEQTISIQKSIHEPTLVRVNHQFCRSGSQLAELFPLLVLYQDIFSIIDAGPSVRRQILDWGMFHVKHEYHPIWKNYQYLLKQRNALLKQRAGYHQVEIWDQQLAQTGEMLNQMRQSYFMDWQKSFEQVMGGLSALQGTIGYYQGWDRKGTGQSLYDSLKAHYPQDLQRQYTQYGAHQADIVIESKEMKARQILSRGQQKIILFGLRLAQASLLAKPCLIMVDDLAAELDRRHALNILTHLRGIGGQQILTGIDAALFKEFAPDEHFISLE